MTYKRKKDSIPSEINEPYLIYLSPTQRIDLIRKGLPLQIIEYMSQKFQFPIHQILNFLGMPQTTYNKKLRVGETLDAHLSEQILAISDLMNEGLSIFNGERSKFEHWLDSSNLSLNGRTPKSLFDTQTGLNEVQKCLQRIEYGNFA